MGKKIMDQFLSTAIYLLVLMRGKPLETVGVMLLGCVFVMRISCLNKANVLEVIKTGVL